MPILGGIFGKVRLRMAGVKSNVIDLLLRHPVGNRRTSVHNDRSLATSFAEIATAQEQVLAELGVEPLCGLSKNLRGTP